MPQKPAAEEVQNSEKARPEAAKGLPGVPPVRAFGITPPKLTFPGRQASQIKPIPTPKIASIYPGQAAQQEVAPSPGIASIYPDDIFAPSSSGAVEDDDDEFYSNQAPPKPKKRGRPPKEKKVNLAPPHANYRSEPEILAEAQGEIEILYTDAKRRAAMDLKPIMEQMLNQPIESVKAPGQTIDRTTLIHQEKIAVGLLRRFGAENSIGFGIDDFPYIKFANWLLTYAVRVAPRTYKKYANCVIDYLSNLPGEDIEQAINILLHSGIDNDPDDEDETETSEMITSESGEPRRKHIIKAYPINDLVLTLRYLRHNSYSVHANDLSNLLEASVMTGLRPVEWKAAAIMVRADPKAPHQRRVWLFVANAKATNGRGNGLIRSIDISEFSDAALQPVVETVKLAREMTAQGKFEIDFRERFIKMMYRTTMLVFNKDPEKGYSLYSCRHQASANWKSLMTAVEVAALSGHAIPKTTQRWYGQKKTAWPRRHLTAVARPSPEEVKLVIERMQMVRRHEAMLISEENHPIDPDELLMFKK